MGVLIILVTLITYFLGTRHASLMGTVTIVAGVGVLLFFVISMYSLVAAPSYDFVYYNVAAYKVWGVFIGGKLHYTIPATSMQYAEITQWVRSQLGGKQGIEQSTQGKDVILIGVFVKRGKTSQVPTILTLPLHDVLFFDSQDNTLLLNAKYYIPRKPWEYLLFIPARSKITYHLFTAIYSEP